MSTVMFYPGHVDVVNIYEQLEHLRKIGSQGMSACTAAREITCQQIATLLEISFWTSLRTDEGRVPKVCVAIADRRDVREETVFSQRLPFVESQLAKLAPAIPKSGCLLLDTSGDTLTIRGFTDTRPVSWPCQEIISVEIQAPGTIRVNVGPYHPFAVVSGRTSSLVLNSGSNLAIYLHKVLQKTFPPDDFYETQAVWRECVAMSEIARNIREQGHGGAVLVVPTDNGGWTKFLNPFPYRFENPNETIHKLIRAELRTQSELSDVIQRLNKADMAEDLRNLAIAQMRVPSGGNVRSVVAAASLAAVDGAIVLTRELKILGFGAKISVEGEFSSTIRTLHFGSGREDQLQSTGCSLEALGGTRHQSAARFVGANPEAVAIVISQDRRISVIHWDNAFAGLAVIRNAEWWT